MKVCLLAVLICGSVAPSGGQEKALFRTEIGLVNTTVLVKSADGALLTDLAKEDFEVLEDGVAQRIQFFAREKQIPLSLALVIDVSGSQDRFLQQHNEDVEKFLKAVLSSTDRAVAICFGNHLRLVSDATASIDQIMDGLRGFAKGDRKFPEIGPKEQRDLGTALYDALYFTIEEKLKQAEERRKVLVVFSDGEENSSEHDLLDAIEAAQNEDTIIYSIRYTDVEHGVHLLGKRGKQAKKLADLLAEHGESGGLSARNKVSVF